MSDIGRKVDHTAESAAVDAADLVALLTYCGDMLVHAIHAHCYGDPGCGDPIFAGAVSEWKRAKAALQAQHTDGYGAQDD